MSVVPSKPIAPLSSSPSIQDQRGQQGFRRRGRARGNRARNRANERRFSTFKGDVKVGIYAARIYAKY